MSITIKKSAVIGAGIMGNGIAQVLAQAGIDVIMNDLEERFLLGGLNSIKKSVGRIKKRGKISEDEAENVLSRIKTTLDLGDAVRDADVVIEAVDEDLALKQEIFRKLDEICPERTILVTNTSTILIRSSKGLTKGKSLDWVCPVI